MTEARPAREVATLGGGCFWCLEPIFDDLKGVEDVVSGYSGGSVRYATAAGASVRYSFTGRSVGVVLTRRPDGGKVKVYVDGSYVTTINTAASTTAYRQLLFARSWSAAGTHSIRLVVVGGTAGHARIDLDAFALLR